MDTRDINPLAPVAETVAAAIHAAKGSRVETRLADERCRYVAYVSVARPSLPEGWADYTIEISLAHDYLVVSDNVFAPRKLLDFVREQLRRIADAHEHWRVV